MGVIYRNEQHSGKDVTTQTLPKILGLTKQETIEFHSFVSQRPRPGLCVCPVCNKTFGKGETALLICSEEDGKKTLRLVHDNDHLPQEISLVAIYSGTMNDADLKGFKEILFENIAACKVEHIGANRGGEDFRKHRREHSAPRKQLPERIPVSSR